MTRNLHKTLYLACLAALLIAAPFAHADDDRWTTDLETAKAEAAESQRDLLLDFTGSDWCVPCRRLKAEVFDQVVFRNEAPKSFVLVKLDYPRTTELPADVAKQNEAMKKRYNIRTFPTIMLADAQARPYAIMSPYDDETPGEYLKKLLALRDEYRKPRDAAFAKAAEASDDLEKAKLLDEGLRHLDPALIAPGYQKTVAQIIALDAENKAGLRGRYQSLAQFSQLRAALDELLAKDAGERIKAIDALMKEVELTAQPLQELHFERARALFELKRLEDAKAALQAAHEAAPHAPRAGQIEKIQKQLGG